MMGSCVWRGGGTGTLFPTLLMEWKPVQLLGKTAGHGLLKLNTIGAADLVAPSLQMQSHTHHRMDSDVHSSTVHDNHEQETPKSPSLGLTIEWTISLCAARQTNLAHNPAQKQLDTHSTYCSTLLS